MKKLLNKNILKISLLILVLYGLWWLFVGAYYAYPNTEDLSVIAFSRDNGIVWSTINVLHSNDGRYLVNFLHGLNPLAYGWYSGYKMMPIFTIICFIYAVYLFINELFLTKAKADNLLFSAAFVVLFLSSVDLSLSLYWMICCFVYVYPIFLFLFFLTFSLKYLRTIRAKYYFISLMFLFLSNGNNELYFPIFGLAILFMVIKNWKNRSIRSALMGYIIIYGLSALLFLTSPGVLTRFNGYSKPRTLKLGHIIPNSFHSSIESIFNLNVFLIFLFLIVFVKFYGIAHKLKVFPNISVILTSIALVFFSWTFVMYATAETNSTPRILPVINVLIFISLFFTVLLFNKYFSLTNNMTSLILCTVFLFTNNSFKGIQRDFETNKLQQFKVEMDYQYSMLTQQNHQQDSCATIVRLNNIEPFIPKSVAIMGTRNFIQPNRTDGKTNRAYEDYFKVDEVRLKNDTTQLILKRVYEKFN